MAPYREKKEQRDGQEDKQKTMSQKSSKDNTVSGQWYQTEEKSSEMKGKKCTCNLEEGNNGLIFQVWIRCVKVGKPDTEA